MWIYVHDAIIVDWPPNFRRQEKSILFEEEKRIKMKTTGATTILLVALRAMATGAFVVQPQTSTLQLSRTYQPVTALSVVDTETEVETKAAPSTAAVEQALSTEEKKNDPTQLFQKIKDAGVAGSISLFLWEGAFWAISVPLAILGYYKVAGHWPDLSEKDDLASVGAEAFAFANVARFALPLRIGLAVSTTPWVQDNIVDRFMKPKDEADE